MLRWLTTIRVSTHSRPKAAGGAIRRAFAHRAVSTHSRPKAAGWIMCGIRPLNTGFNTQPPEGGWAKTRCCQAPNRVSTHSRPKAAGRRMAQLDFVLIVSTHSRPKAAGFQVA